MAINELKRVTIRLVEESPLISKKNISSAEDAISVLGDFISGFDREVLCVINLNTKNQPINCNLCSMGTLDTSPISAREIFKSAVLSNAARIILMHNHPSGDPTPSKIDYKATDLMIRAGEILSIPVIDHVIVGSKNNYYSMASEGPLKSKSDIDLTCDSEKIAAKLKANITIRKKSTENKLIFISNHNSENLEEDLFEESSHEM